MDRSVTKQKTEKTDSQSVSLTDFCSQKNYKSYKFLKTFQNSFRAPSRKEAGWRWREIRVTD